VNKVVSILLILSLILFLIVLSGCGGGQSTTSQASTNQAQTSGQNSKTTVGQPSGTSIESGLLRNENWLLGTWSASVPKTDTSIFAGNKIKLNVASVMLISNEKVQEKPTGKFAYSGSLVWDTGSEARTLGFVKEDWKTGDGAIIWEYASPGANQFLENITMRVYDSIFAFELDWGPQMSKPGSNYKSLGFYGSIQNQDNSDRNEFDPNNMITFSQTSTTSQTTASTNPTATGGSRTSTAKTSTTSSPPKTTTTSSGTGDIWKDIPVYPNAQRAEDEGFQMTGGADESYSQIEWHFFASSDEIAKVVNFYKKQMPANGWTKMMFFDGDEMSYGAFQKNNETRMCLVYMIQSEGGTAINIQSAAK
jgi:hypothetical protein